MDYAEDQRLHWNSASGHAWVASQILARLFEPLADRLAARSLFRRRTSPHSIRRTPEDVQD